MAYAQIHTQALTHPKVVALSHAAFRVWVSGLCYCQAHLTDGVITTCAVPALLGKGLPRRTVEELVDAGLWDIAADGYRIHDYLDWNHSRETVERRREKWRRKRGGGTQGTPPGTPPGTQPGAYDPIRSTDQNQDQDHRPGGRDEHRAAARTRPNRRVRLRDANPSVLVKLAHLVLDQDPETEADAEDLLKAAASHAGLAYDGRAIGKALDQAHVQRTKRGVA